MDLPALGSDRPAKFRSERVGRPQGEGHDRECEVRVGDAGEQRVLGDNQLGGPVSPTVVVRQAVSTLFGAVYNPIDEILSHNNGCTSECGPPLSLRRA